MQFYSYANAKIKNFSDQLLKFSSLAYYHSSQLSTNSNGCMLSVLQKLTLECNGLLHLSDCSIEIY